jgi:hypothetical protein
MLCLSTTTTGKTTGIAVTASGQFAVGTSTSLNITQLAAQFNPGASPRINGCQWLIFGGVCLFFTILLHATINSWDGASLFFLVLTVASVAGPFIQSKWIKETGRPTWEGRVKTYELGWICLQCGKTWIPPTP